MKKIDGRKAVIIEVGRIFSTYRDFAVKHGYPDAAAVNDRDDKRRKPQNGDIVTLLTSGEHSNRGYGYPLWIVEMANGERQIIGEVGLRILETEGGEDMTNITVLKDEAIGGVAREYRAVSRPAVIGDRIKIVNAWESCGKYENGDILTVDRAGVEFDGKGVECDTVSAPGNSSGYITSNEYLVLEPTDIVRIDGKDGQSVRYRLAERKAIEGDRIIFGGDHSHITAGRVYNVYDSDFDGGEFKEDRGRARWQFSEEKPKSYVIEPLKTDSPDGFAATDEQAAEDDAALLVLQRQIDNLTDAVAKLTAHVFGRSEKAVTGTVNPSVPESMPPQMQRDAIVARAKADVKELETTYRAFSNGDAVSFWPEACRNQGFSPNHFVEYVIDRNKRTVVALIKYLSIKTVVYRGIAKAAPDDCFNEHIGKAIALRRALELPVPSDYLNAPQPEGARVGDVIKWNNVGDKYEILGIDGRYYDFKNVGSGEYLPSVPYDMGISQYCTVIDDSARYNDKEVAA